MDKSLRTVHFGRKYSAGHGVVPQCVLVHKHPYFRKGEIGIVGGHLVITIYADAVKVSGSTPLGVDVKIELVVKQLHRWFPVYGISNDVFAIVPKGIHAGYVIVRDQNNIKNIVGVAPGINRCRHVGHRIGSGGVGDRGGSGFVVSVGCHYPVNNQLVAAMAGMAWQKLTVWVFGVPVTFQVCSRVSVPAVTVPALLIEPTLSYNRIFLIPLELSAVISLSDRLAATGLDRIVDGRNNAAGTAAHDQGRKDDQQGL